MNDWINLPAEVENCEWYWVASKTRNGECVCLGYCEYDENETVWFFGDNSIAHWKDEPMDEHGFEPYAVMKYQIPRAPKRQQWKIEL